MTARLLDGRDLASHLRRELAHRVERLTGGDPTRAPRLAILRSGPSEAAGYYAASLERAARSVGVEALLLSGDDDPLLETIDALNEDPRVAGIVVAQPLADPEHGRRLVERIDPAKDVDGFHIANAGRLAVGERALVPCTPLGCLMLLKDRLGDLSGLEAVVLGRSNIVGKPMAQLLLQENCTITIAHSRTRDLPQVVRRADIVVAAVGRPQMVRGDWLKPGATVIDVGINRITVDNEGKTRLVGDVDFDSAAEVAGAITPVPGGVGPMTIAVLLRNTLVAAHARAGLAPPDGL